MNTIARAQQLIYVTIKDDGDGGDDGKFRPLAMFGIQRIKQAIRESISTLFDPNNNNPDNIFDHGTRIVFSENVIILSGASYASDTVRNEVILHGGDGGSVAFDSFGTYDTAAILIDAATTSVTTFSMIIDSKIPFFAMAWE
eukprot:CAMPEP_0118695008 /NCGR_PEP_ID=MMETSP0800-20121206/12910_1 /TAXON_ID=210618 ORGANISM="Striatella unipunctata, Strain CCMP2910" /NCGR_SAMPLE_ID=MMETSP0800 /ASSEMBLY_ACC=CAM_ASM_000638 /LENGTH=141 /DNA_ID=CAMNT_0006593677 /DNA_START=13 /DNA_END=438 /DNA_ORIENTATION=-